MPYLIGSCDIYAAPSRLEGFGMPQVEAGACGKPVIGLKAMGMLDTLVHGETAFLANVAKTIVVDHVTLGDESGFEGRHRLEFKEPRTVDYRADVHEGLVVKHKPYYAFWSYKIYNSERFDLLGNSLAILSRYSFTLAG